MAEARHISFSSGCRPLAARERRAIQSLMSSSAGDPEVVRNAPNGGQSHILLIFCHCAEGAVPFAEDASRYAT
jgi:hypothetical protein